MGAQWRADLWVHFPRPTHTHTRIFRCVAEKPNLFTAARIRLPENHNFSSLYGYHIESFIRPTIEFLCKATSMHRKYQIISYLCPAEPKIPVNMHFLSIFNMNFDPPRAVEHLLASRSASISISVHKCLPFVFIDSIFNISLM